MKAMAVISDLVGSRDLSDRRGTQEALGEVLEAINAESEAIASPYTITLGDEFQVVYDHAGGMFGDFWRILARLYPVKVRFSVGVGQIVTDINPDRALGMDGPAFHAAREGIETMANKGTLFRVQGDVEMADFVNESLDLVSTFTRNWQKNRFDILCCLYRGEEAKEIADRVDLSVRAVYKNIEKGALETVMALTGEIEHMCQRGLEEQ